MQTQTNLVDAYALMLQRLDELAGYNAPALSYYRTRADRLRVLAEKSGANATAVLELALHAAQLDVQGHPNFKTPAQ